MSDNETHDAHHSKRGDFYQPLVAIKYAITKENVMQFNKLTIEHDGDVSFDDILQIETKHHKDPTALGDKSEDFWKTLYNWVIQKKAFKELILHTTAHYSKTGISHLKKWNNKNADDKYKILKNIKFDFKLSNFKDFRVDDKNIFILKNRGLKEHEIGLLLKSCGKNKRTKDFKNKVDSLNIDPKFKKIILEECKDTSAKTYKIWNFSRVILSFNEKKVKEIIGKATIYHSQAIDNEIWKELKALPFFSIMPINSEKDFKYFIEERVAGSIASKVVGESRWEVTRAEFDTNIQNIATQFFNDHYRPSFDKYLRLDPDDLVVDQNQDKLFVEELKAMKCETEEVKEAIVEYWKTNTLIAEEIEEDLNFYDDEYCVYKMKQIYPRLIGKKRRCKSNENLELNLAESLEFYRNVLEMNFEDYRSIKSLDYFEHGTMQNIVEDEANSFNWILK
jgi:hypothetical protein